MASVGVALPPDSLATCVSAFDRDGSGMLDYRAFTRAAAPLFGAALRPDKARSELATGNLAKIGSGVSVLAGVAPRSAAWAEASAPAPEGRKSAGNASSGHAEKALGRSERAHV